MFTEEKSYGASVVDYRTVCRDAAQYIEDHGWCQNHWLWDTQVCLEQALRSVARGDLFLAARKALLTTLQIPDQPGALTGWNDTHSKEEVLSLLRQVAYL